MPKRFTESSKWKDPWFMALRPTWKLAWHYLVDECDAAGVLDLNRPLADFSIGEPVDWDAFLEACGARVRILDSGKVYVTGFIRFQYGQLSETCNPHKKVFDALRKHNIDLSEVYQVGYQVPYLGREQDKEEDNTKTKTNKGGVGGKRFKPPSLETVQSYIAEKGYDVDAEAFVAHYEARGWFLSNGRQMRDWRASCVTWHKNAAKFGPNVRGSPARKSKSESATEEFLRRHGDGDPSSGSGGGESHLRLPGPSG